MRQLPFRSKLEMREEFSKGGFVAAAELLLVAGLHRMPSVEFAVSMKSHGNICIRSVQTCILSDRRSRYIDDVLFDMGCRLLIRDDRMC